MQIDDRELVILKSILDFVEENKKMYSQLAECEKELIKKILGR